MPQLSAEECQRELERLRDDLERACSASKRAKEELQAFVYAVSHDVKESLRSVSSYTQLMLRQPPGSPEFGEFAQCVTEGVKTAVVFLDRANAFARIDLSPKTANVNLSALVQAAILKQQPAIRDTGAQVTFRDLPAANVNEAQFGQLIDNLLDNALRYRSAMPPSVEIWSEEMDDGRVLIVKDNGSGIGPEYLNSVFQPFKRLHRKGLSGIGLGLAAAAKIAAAHAGRIWVESDGQSGSTFKVFLPF